jgi:uncharacterized protein
VNRFQKMKMKKATFKNEDGEVWEVSLYIASSYWERMRGLLGVSEMHDSAGLYIEKCNSIHTFFMKMNLDVLYLSRKNRIKTIFRNISPWRLLLPRLGVCSVVEFKAGTVPLWVSDKTQISLED